MEEPVNGQTPEKFVEEMAQQLGITTEEFKDEYGDFSYSVGNVQGNLEFKEDETYVEVINGDERKGTWSAGSDRMLEGSTKTRPVTKSMTIT